MHVATTQQPSCPQLEARTQVTPLRHGREKAHPPTENAVPKEVPRASQPLELREDAPRSVVCTVLQAAPHAADDRSRPETFLLRVGAI